MRSARLRWFTLLLFLVATAAWWAALSMPRGTRLLPVFAGSFVVLLLLLELAMDLVPGLRKRYDGARSRRSVVREEGARRSAETYERSRSPHPPRSRELRAIAWYAGGAVSILLGGFGLGLPLFVALATRFGGRERWLSALVSGALAALLVHGVFEGLLQVSLYPGWIAGQLP